jgi:hypothetical protein
MYKDDNASQSSRRAGPRSTPCVLTLPQMFGAPPCAPPYLAGRMLAPGEVQGDLLALPGRNDPAGEYTGAFVIGLTLQLEHPHAGVVVVYHLALRGLPDQLIPRRFGQLQRWDKNRGMFLEEPYHDFTSHAVSWPIPT